MNEIYFFINLLMSMCGTVIIYKIWGKTGLVVWISIATIIANLQVLKTVDLFGMQTTLGNALVGTSFLATDIINEKWGAKESKKAVLIALFVLIFFTFAMQLNLLFIPSESDTVHASLALLFSQSPRVCFASIVVFATSNLLDTYFYAKIKAKFPSKSMLWLRNNGSTLLSQLIDTFLFTFVAFAGVLPKDVLVEIFVSTYLIKIIISLFDTPFLYLADKIKLGVTKNG